MATGTAQRLEQYTAKHPREVLLVMAEIEGQMDQIAIFKGYSSSLMQPTAFDLDKPVLPDSAKIITIDRLEGPYNPHQPHYLQQGLTWDEFQPLLADTGG